MSPSRTVTCLTSDQRSYQLRGGGLHASRQRRRVHLDKALEFRRELHTSRHNWRLSSTNTSIWRVSWQSTRCRRRSGSGLSGGQRSPEPGQTALRQQEKIERYEADLDELRSVWKSKTKWWQKPSNARKKRGSRGSCRTGSGRAEKPACDYQQALDVQQTRAIQYNQAMLHLIVPKNCAICRT